jgi:hypothetical protein
MSLCSTERESAVGSGALCTAFAFEGKILTSGSCMPNEVWGPGGAVVVERTGVGVLVMLAVAVVAVVAASVATGTVVA